MILFPGNSGCSGKQQLLNFPTCGVILRPHVETYWGHICSHSQARFVGLWWVWIWYWWLSTWFWSRILYDFAHELNMILNVGINMTTNLGSNMNTQVDGNMITNVGINMTTDDPGWSQNDMDDPKMILLMIPKWPSDDPKVSRAWLEMFPGWSENNPRWPENHPRMTLRWPSDDTQTIPKWYSDDPQIIPRWP